jgi:hypothetical protein
MHRKLLPERPCAVTFAVVLESHATARLVREHEQAFRWQDKQASGFHPSSLFRALGGLLCVGQHLPTKVSSGDSQGGVWLPATGMHFFFYCFVAKPGTTLVFAAEY